MGIPQAALLKDELLDEDQTQALEKDTKLWRERLSDLSWYMRVLNERIAREANAEDECTGRFWGERYYSQALLDEGALLSCMAYVDLNAVRAGLADTPETSEHTSIKKRIEAEVKFGKQPAYLLPFGGQKALNALPFEQLSYFKLVDWTSRKIQEGKGFVAQSQPDLLTRVGIDEHEWLTLTQNFGSRFKGFIGATSKLRRLQTFSVKILSGISACKVAFGI